MINKLILFFCFFIIFTTQGQTLSEFIHVDQFGYMPNSKKIAVISNPQIGYNSDLSYVPPIEFEIRYADSNELLLTKSPTIWNNGVTDESSGDKGWWLDFSEITEEGSYYILDVSSNERSSVFNISEAVYTNVIKAAGRMFYYNRCNFDKVEPFAQGWTDETNFNNPLQDFNTRYIYDPENLALEKDLSGGWFDAGDYNKYVTFASPALHDLLWAYEENPIAFNDNWNIPESSNGIPDIIDEIKWELDWLLKMNNPDGSTHIKMGNQNYNENAASPPSENYDQRFYGPICTSASIAAAGVFAHAARVFKTFEGFENYSALLQERAISSYNYSKFFVDEESLLTNCDDGSIVAGDADRTEEEQKNEFLTAAIYLYALTQENIYNSYVIDNVLNTSPIVTNYWGVGDRTLNDGLLYYTSLPNANVTIKDSILVSINESVSNNYNDFFGFNSLDLYRAFIPEWSYHWGSNSQKANYANLNQLLVNYNIIPSQQEAYSDYIDGVIHYFHGVNPQGLVYLSNMYTYGAERSVNEIYHGWFADGTDYDNALSSLYGPSPGFVTGGPNHNFSVETLLPPYGQPDQKSYLDFNDGFPNNSWEISEPAIYYQAAYIRLLANKVEDSQVLFTNSFNTNKKYKLYPNPATSTFTVEGLIDGDQVTLFTSEMRQISDFVLLDDNKFNVSQLNSGFYFLRIASGNRLNFLKLAIK